MTDETPSTPQPGQESQPDRSAAGTRFDASGAPQPVAASAAPQRASYVTAPLAMSAPAEATLAETADVAAESAPAEPAPAEAAAAPTWAADATEEPTPAEPVESAGAPVLPESPTAEDATLTETETWPESEDGGAPQIWPEPEAASTEPAPVAETLAEAPAQPAEAQPAAESAPTMPTRDPEFARYYAVRTHIGPIAFAPDLSQVAYITNTSGQFNIWRQGIGGGWPSQVTTFEDESTRSLIWTPDGEIIGAADHAGGEQYDLFAIPAAGGAVRYLTRQPDAQFELSEEGLSPDGRYLVYSGNDRTPTDGDVLIRDLATGETRRALANGHYNVAVNWSPDGRYVAVMDIRSNTDMRLWLLEAATGEARELLPHDDECYLAPGPWLPDSSGLYLITDRGCEFKGIARYTLANDTMEWVLKPDWDVEQVVLSADGRRLLWTLNESGRSQLHLRDNEQASLRVSGLPIGVIEYMKLSPDGQTLALRINSATAPAEVYILTLGAVGVVSTPHLRRLTFGMLGGLTPVDLTAPELVRYHTFDGREIPAWLYRPRGASETNPAPLVLSIHGGPEAQERVEYHALYQVLLSRGIGVLAPNIRGSTGYGKAYQKLIHRDWGGAELKDIQAAAEYARSLSWVNPRKLGVYGGSFGGFATLSAVTRLPDYWAAAVDIVGPSNLLTFVRSVPPTWRRMMAAWVGDPEADADLLRERSPISYVEQTRAPLLVLQGANDPRVAQAESDQMVERLRGLGREVEYVVFEDEGHGFTKRANLLRAYALTVDFLERRLK
ncbi:MAG TPA: prolyl oligopeptidase family serine peptidase [Ktedonobacterales bacterium]